MDEIRHHKSSIPRKRNLIKFLKNGGTYKFTPLTKLNQIIVKNSILTPKKTQRFSIAKDNWSVLSTEIMTVYSENYMKPINTLYGQTAELPNVKANGTHNYHPGILLLMHPLSLSTRIWSEDMKGRDRRVHAWIILKWILMKYGGKMWIVTESRSWYNTARWGTFFHKNNKQKCVFYLSTQLCLT
jgi:hypothetical protein